MNLLKREGEQFVFRIGKRERNILLEVLKRYPVAWDVPYKISQSADPRAAEADQRLLEEALAEQKKENKLQLEAMLNSEGRFVEDDLGYRFTLTIQQMDWLLQVLNDIRVGSWMRLGSPDPKEGKSVKISEENLQLGWAMEMAGLYEMTLLQALREEE